MLLNVVLLSCGLILLILASVVIYSNYRSSDNIMLGLIIISAFIWLAANYFANIAHSAGVDIFFTRGAFVGASLVPLTFLLFCYSFSGRKKILKIFKYILIFLPIIVLLLSTPTGLNVRNVSGTSFQTGPAYILLSIVYVIYFTVGTAMLIKEYKISTHLRRQQLTYILLGIILTLIPGFLFNALLPILGYSSSVSYGPVAVLFFAILTSIAIVRHKLFDIRLVIARSLSYAFVVFLIVLIYAVLVVFISSHLLHSPIKNNIVVFLAIVTLITTFLLQPLRSSFNKLTNRLFFRDYYVIQDIIDSLGNLLVGSVNPNEIEHKSAKILNNALKADNSIYLLKGKDATKDSKELLELLQRSKKKLVTTDELDSHSHKILLDSLIRQNIAIAVRLRTTQEDLGFITFGHKQSGSAYSSTDRRLLSIAADEIAISLQNALRFEEIQRFNITLQAKVDEATKELKKTNEKLKALDETKDDFISMASHQLRTPLSIIKGYVNMVVHGDAGKINGQQKEFLEQVQISSETMVRLVTELLNVSRITSGRFSVDSNPVNLADIVENEVQQLANMAKERDVNLTFQKPRDFPILMLDEEKIRQVIANFIDNAIHYSRDKDAKINVQLTNGDDIIFEVIDNGIGVPQSEKEHLFTKFYRAKNAQQARPNGTGVGIYLAKVVINELGGDLIFESKEGVGSTFGFRFKKDKIIPSDKTS